MEFEVNNDTVFQDADHKPMKLSEIIKYIQTEVYSNNRYQYRISIGTDSMTCRDTVFVLCIVLYKVGRGGVYFYKKFTHPRIENLRTKLYNETQLSLSTADIIIEDILEKDESLYNKINFSIHLDIGENGPTKDLIRELEGWVTAMGYDYAIKPDSYAASTIANMHSK